MEILDRNYQIKSGWQLLATFTFPSDPELMMLRNELNEAEIPNHLLDKSLGSALPMMSGEKGGLQL